MAITEGRSFQGVELTLTLLWPEDYMLIAHSLHQDEITIMAHASGQAGASWVHSRDRSTAISYESLGFLRLFTNEECQRGQG
jgi:hypothetical protein